jgi:hypothetical protein
MAPESNLLSWRLDPMKLESFFLSIVLIALPMSPENVQQFDSICTDGADLAIEASEARENPNSISIDEMLSRAYQENRPRYLGARIDPDPIFSEVILQAILFAYGGYADGLTRTQVFERFYSVCRRNINSESANQNGESWYSRD